MKMIGHRLRHVAAWLPVFLSGLMLACSNNPQVGNTNAPVRSEPPNYEGYHDITNCNGIVGWAWDTNRPNDALKVDIYVDDGLFATVTADGFRQDLLDAHRGNGKHGFLYPTPLQIKDGKPHTIRMKFAGTSVDLQFTPKVLNCQFGE